MFLLGWLWGLFCIVFGLGVCYVWVGVCMCLDSEVGYGVVDWIWFVLCVWGR